MTTAVKTDKVKSNGKDKSGLVYYVPADATSFDDVEENVIAERKSERVGELTRIFQDLVWNIMHNEDVPNKDQAISHVTNQFNDRVNEVVEGGDAGLFKSLIRNLTDAVNKPKEKPDQPSTGFMIWKEDGQYRWLAVYSNKYRDQDHPPEILAEVAHQTFIKEVEQGKYEYPDLWHWHIPGTKWGKADWLAYDKATGFTLASGYVDEGHEGEAELVMALSEPLLVSHGMPIKSIERDPNDPSVITRYVSVEISPLPSYAAANKLTGFKLMKESTMAIPDEKKDYLRLVGLTDDKISEIEADLGNKAKQAQDEQLDFKEDETKPETEVEEATVDADEKEGDEPEQDVEPTETEAPEFATRQEVADAIVTAVKPLSDSVSELAASIKEMTKTDEEKISQKATDIPATSIAAIVARQLSVKDADVTRVDGRSSLAKDKPDEAETETKEVVTGIPWLDQMLKESDGEKE